ncbi:alpha,alpha-trehalose-phosphate synthase (UDP-forming) [Aquibium microcysteis]|uniref:alpha,alpha-trehalose-phosphate synthase (UDP-forming) n=1 Tax=Aquibium microcysteis TaxID=675281 RepID=UPI00165D116D|nr:trehalose-6-phosphate synthase [Aquibium microcysteis]
MSRLVVVSNRVADLRKATQSGGLAVAIADALKARGGVWFGWDGNTLEDETEKLGVDRVGDVDVISSPLTVEDYSQYYIGYANSVLWPLFHYRIDLVDYRPQYFEGYMRVNDKFASLLKPFLKQRDMVWVHDYHLIPFAERLRALGCRQKTGFFLHIPFPPPDILAASPNHAYLVEALLSYDVVGFQTSTDLNNFNRYVEENMPDSMGPDGVIMHGGRTVRAIRLPIGIDVAQFTELAEKTFEDINIDHMRRAILGQRQIVGVDRLDYSKGIPERFEAFSRMLYLHPELEKSVTFLQIAPPTREDVTAYSEIRMKLEGLAGSINGKFGDIDWVPIRYIHRPVPRPRLAAMFRSSEVGLVTPLRDGMNLVAKEYVAAQNPADPGVLVLSQFAGAAEELGDALIVNPHDTEEMGEKMELALRMPLEERQNRHASLLKRVKESDVGIWMSSFIDELEAAEAQGGAAS